jgi:transposase
LNTRYRLADYPTRNSQILALPTILRDEFQYAWSSAQMGYIFNVKKGIVHRVRSQIMREIEHDTGRPPILQPNQEAELIAYITSHFQDGSPLSPKQIRQYVSETFGKEVSSSWAWRLVSRYSGVLQHATAHPQEDIRM